jgi:AmmeMemoRadiSam system protein B
VFNILLNYDNSTSLILLSVFSNPAEYPPIIPILVGNTSASVEKQYGALLAPYLADPTSLFVVSSDFAHWGSRFRYTYYQPNDGAAVKLKEGSRPPTYPLIHESIQAVDMMCVEAIEKGDHNNYLDVLERTGNTVCGRHPIGIVMAAIEELKRTGDIGVAQGNFKFVKYDRSSEVVSIKDSSVSYCSGFAVM